MAWIGMEIRAPQETLRGLVERDNARRLLGSLAADPRTSEELLTASGRFWDPPLTRGDLFPATLPTVLGTGRVSELRMDLASRVLWGRNLPFPLKHEGWAHSGGSTGENVRLFPFHLASDWQVVKKVDDYDYLSLARRSPGDNVQVAQYRDVLYGPELCLYLVEQLRADHDMVIEGRRSQLRPLFQKIHREWLLTPRDSLQGESPRAAMLGEHFDHVSCDLNHQMMRWASLCRVPPAIPETATAFLNACFGPFERILYYDLIRFLLERYARRLRLRGGSTIRVRTEAQWLQRHLQRWWDDRAADREGCAAAEIVDSERRRVPFTCTPRIACECPMCRTIRRTPSLAGIPTFLLLDDSHLDDEFAFSTATEESCWEPTDQGRPSCDMLSPRAKSRTLVLHTEDTWPGDTPSRGISDDFSWN